MNISLDSPETLQENNDWKLQGRIIPPSCTSGDGCILHLQTRHKSWPRDHFHVGRSPVSCEAGLEFVMSLLTPVSEELECASLDIDEREHDIEYLKMARLGHPPDAIAFLTMTGLTIVVQIKGIEAMFGQSDKCQDCSKSTNVITLPDTEFVTEGDFDYLMELKDEKSH